MSLKGEWSSWNLSFIFMLICSSLPFILCECVLIRIRLTSLQHTLLQVLAGTDGGFKSSSLCVCESCSVVSDSLWPHGLYSTWNSPSQNTGVGSLSLLQGIFSTQGLNPGVLHCRLILSQLSYQGSLKILCKYSLT